MLGRLVRSSPSWSAIAALVLFAPALCASGGADDATVRQVQALLANYQEDPTRLQQARLLLEAATRTEPQPETLALLSRVWFLIGEVLSPTGGDRVAAFGQGRDVGRRAIEAAPQSAAAHLWYAINTGRWAQEKGMLHAALAFSKLLDEADQVLRLDPNSVEGHALAGSLAAHVPRAMGGDVHRAEKHFRRALEIDPHNAGIRVELARLYVTLKRDAEAREELTRALQEPSPTDVPYWRLKVEPEARALLASLTPR
jgi:tetratricopeptide (TPR) repeat protein